jgi:non-specific serine/threonine protein kinase/serine/threonine-protein kinase
MTTGPDRDTEADLPPLTSSNMPTSAASGGDSATGSVIGPYHLLQLIAEGGMGQVWLAEQKQPVRRRVAVKLIKVGMDTREVVARFESERQALALMDHPAIAKVFDAGSTPEGRPYFVMEYVPGLPITDYCDYHKLSVRQRMELFIRVCEGVQHAHQKAIIHRDIKPSNILVTEIDGKPVPRIIDFGIAKATSQQLTPGTMYTRVGMVVGTMGYMSPEQADSGGQDIDTRTDVYSLGVVLYELLVGTLPIDFGKLAYDEVLKRLRETDAPRPSTRLRVLGDSSTATAQNRGADLVALTRQLRGDADAIAVKALEKDRKQRYGSPSELAADIRRYLRNEPVLAHRPSFGYRAGKYLRRHSLGVGVAAVALLLLIGFAIAQTVELRRIKQQRDRADRITTFMTDMFKVSDPSQARGNDVRVREILDKASSKVLSGLAQDPIDQAELMQVMGDVYQNLGLYPQAESLTKHALAIRTARLGMKNRETLRSKTSLTELLLEEGKYADAEKLARETLDVRTKTYGPEDRGTVQSMNQLGLAFEDQGRYHDAEELHRKALEIASRKFGADDPLTLKAVINLAIDLAYEGNLPAAEEQFRRVLQIRLDNGGPDDPNTLAAEINLGAVLLRQDRYAEAEKIYRELVQRARRVLGADHPTTLLAMGNLGLTLSLEERDPEAEQIFRETLAIKQRKLGAEHRSTLVTAGNLADVLREEGKNVEAEALLRSTLAAERRTLGNDHSDTLATYEALGLVLTAEHRYPEAERVFREAYDSRVRLLGHDNLDTADTGYNLAGVYALEGKKTEAIAQLNDAVEHRLSSKFDLQMPTEPNLKPLRGDPAFEGVVANARRHAEAAKAAK